jgi:hypothetical protein
MKIEIVKEFDKTYKTCNGTYYQSNTPEDLILIMEDLRNDKKRIIIDYGDVRTGRSYLETYETLGTVGRSSGLIKVPILLHNSRSTGGGSIMTDSILSIKLAKGKSVIYSRNLIQSQLN